jgi:hypothetical protein
MRGSTLRIFRLSALFIQLLSAPQIVLAQVYINEFLPNPDDPSDASEWIELFNASDQVVSLDGFSLSDASSSKPYSLTGQLDSKSYLLIPKNESNLALNNSGDTINLKNSADQIIDTFSYETTKENWVYARVPDASSNWSMISDATPGQFNSIPQSSEPEPSLTEQTTIHLSISKLNPCPEKNQPEWVELTNLSQTSGLINDWIIQDQADHQIKFSHSFSPKESFQVTLSPSILNNSGDQIFLKNQQGKTIDQATYEACKPGSLLVLVNGSWIDPTLSFTPPNVSLAPDVPNTQPSQSPNILTIITNPTPSLSLGNQERIAASTISAQMEFQTSSVAGIIDQTRISTPTPSPNDKPPQSSSSSLFVIGLLLLTGGIASAINPSLTKKFITQIQLIIAQTLSK